MKITLARLVASFVILCAFCVPGKAAIYPGSNSAWLVVASRDNPNAAISYARQLAGSLPSVSVFRSNNGWYAITLGWSKKSSGKRAKANLISQGLIPSDSYFHSGERFQELIWSTTGATGGNRSKVLRGTKFRSVSRSTAPRPAQSGTAAYVTGLSSGRDAYLSFRTGPSRSNRELRRLLENTQLSILGQRGRWYNVRLNNGQTGWVYGKYVAFGQAAIAAVNPQPIVRPAVKPAPPPKPKIVVSDEDNGLKLKVSGLTQSGFEYLALRKGPGDNQREIARLREKTKLVVTGKYGEWYRVRPAPSVEGWVKAQFVSAEEVPTFGPSDETKPDAVDIVLKRQPKPEPKPEVKPVTKTEQQPAIQPAGRRVALVLGNSAYAHTTVLPNPKNDADKISAKLKSLGFEVVVGLDGTKAGMESSIRDFVRILPNSDVALFFYAGHAMQVKGNNYLIPIDAKLADSTAIDFETIQLSSILQFVDQPGRISIALLDACRDNPLSRRFARSVGATRSAFIGRGLASPSTSGNLLIGFATAPGEVALDGDGTNSPFTTALLKHIGTPKLEVEAMLKRVRTDVFNSTDKQQSPWVNSGLRRNFFFKN